MQWRLLWRKESLFDGTCCTSAVSWMGHLIVVALRTTFILVSVAIAAALLSMGQAADACEAKGVPKVKLSVGAKGGEDREDAIAGIQLDFRTFFPRRDLPTGGAFVLVRGDGKARAVVYSPYSLTVSTIREGTLPTEKVAQLLGEIQTPPFRNALKQKSFTGSGSEEGDLFHLWTKRKDGSLEEVVGLIQIAPKAVRQLVEEMLAIRNRLKEVNLPYGHVRSERIPNTRFRNLRESGKAQFIPINGFADELRAVIARAIANVGDFVSLSQSQYEYMLKLCSQGHNLFIIEGPIGHQMTLFRSGR